MTQNIPSRVPGRRRAWPNNRLNRGFISGSARRVWGPKYLIQMNQLKFELFDSDFNYFQI